MSAEKNDKTPAPVPTDNGADYRPAPTEDYERRFRKEAEFVMGRPFTDDEWKRVWNNGRPFAKPEPTAPTPFTTDGAGNPALVPPTLNERATFGLADGLAISVVSLARLALRLPLADRAWTEMQIGRIIVAEIEKNIRAVSRKPAPSPEAKDA